VNTQQRIETITAWIRQYADDHRISCLVVGVSGGIDSAVVSTLCARTGIRTVALSMPIQQSAHTHNLSQAHCEWLRLNFQNVETHTLDLTNTFQHFQTVLSQFNSELAFANSRSRMRMMTLYQTAQSLGGIVVGTGNRVEDFGVGFFTKYGDGGVDISPIADCLKNQVWDMGRELGVLEDIVSAAPTDGLWSDSRTDQDQLGMTYPELEEAMRLDAMSEHDTEILDLDQAGRDRLQHYRGIRARNLHKMLPIPVCEMPKDIQ
jgi:NAD+ synthase